MSNKSVRPADILADEVNTAEVAGVTVRKGTVAAVLANLELLESGQLSDDDKFSALAVIEELAPAMVALGLHRHVIWKNSQVQRILDKAAGDA